MDYNVPGGKLNRGMSVVDSVAILKGRDLNESEYFKAAVLGWSVEWVRLFHPAHYCTPLTARSSSKPTSSFPTILWTGVLPVVANLAGTS
jgi:Polyprenyl synthetase